MILCGPAIGKRWSVIDRISPLEKLDVNELRSLAENGNPDAQHRLAWRYKPGMDNVARESYTEFIKWLRKAAAQD